MIDRNIKTSAIRKNWLAHTKKAMSLDEALLDGASMAELQQIRGAVREHFLHLNLEHDLPVTKGSLQMFDRSSLGISDFSGQPTQQDRQEDPLRGSYLPNRKDFESACRALAGQGEEVPLDAILDKVEDDAHKLQLSLKENWRIITERNIVEVWSKISC